MKYTSLLIPLAILAGLIAIYALVEVLREPVTTPLEMATPEQILDALPESVVNATVWELIR